MVERVRTDGPVAVASHKDAAGAAAAVLAEGGSAVDAVIAAGAVLATVLPQATALGGDGFLIHRSAAGEIAALNASGPAPRGAPEKPAPERGPGSVSVPGLVPGWGAAHERFGKLSWERLLAPAIAAAERHPVSPSLASAIPAYRAMLEADPGCRATFFAPDGTPRTVLEQPALAATLRRLAAEGAEAFGSGWGAEAMGRAVQKAGGSLAPADIADYRPEWVTPLRAHYRGREVVLVPPNAYGFYMALQLLCLDGLAPETFGADEDARFGALIDAMRAAFEVGRPHVYDGSTARLDDPAIREALANAFQTRRAASPPPNRGGTATVTAVDREGNVAVHILSVFMLFGSGFLDPETGILFQNRMAGFGARPVEPGKRPPHTLNPALVLKDGRPEIALATPGGPGQTLTLVQVLSNMFDRGMAFDAAVAAPRWSVDFAGEAILEADGEGASAALAEKVTASGRQLTVATPGTPFFGSVEGIAFLEGGGHLAVADSRRDAGACAARKDETR